MPGSGIRVNKHKGPPFRGSPLCLLVVLRRLHAAD